MISLPPHWMPINLVGLDVNLWKPAIDRYAEAYARQAQRMALEEAAKKYDSEPWRATDRISVANVLRRLANELEVKP